MIELLIGAVAAAGMISVVQHARRNRLAIAWWQWSLTFLGFAWAVLTAEIVLGFLREGMAQGAAVMGTLFGFVAALWGVLLARFVFRAHPGQRRARTDLGESS